MRKKGSASAWLCVVGTSEPYVTSEYTVYPVYSDVTYGLLPAKGVAVKAGGRASEAAISISFTA